MSRIKKISSSAENMTENKLVNRRRAKILCVAAILVFILLVFRTAWIQIINGEWLSRAALEQQTSDTTVRAKRGKIYDRNYKVMASNVTVETISISPKNVRESAKNKNLSIKTISEDMAEILSLNEEEIEKKINRESGFEYIKKKVDKEEADKLREYIEDKGVSGISFVEDVKRYYPYNNLASHVIGFVGDDNQGLEGIESVYDNSLSGIPGRVVTTRYSAGMESNSGYESYIEAEDGSNVVLTIDEVIQSYTEKYLEQARIGNKLEEGAAAIVMDVNTGEVLAMATKPDYDLNKPFEITSAIEEKNPGVTEELKGLEGLDYITKFNEVIQTVRRNKAVVDSYEPGSTFKAFVAASSIETGACTLNDTFTCGGSVRVGPDLIHCANRSGHGHQTFAQAVQNSCNPAFISIGQKIGGQQFLKSMRAFGFFEETGIELPGETAGVGFMEADFKEIDLATSSFGQSITVTPLQMITAVSAIANGGTLYKPHLVKEIVNSNNIVIEKIQPEIVRQVVSEETSKTMCSVLESVVSQGGGKNAYLAGYRIAGKTGTSEKLPRGNQKYIASFISFAPADDPKVACLVILDQPEIGMPYYGGTIAAPVVKNILEETLRYLDVEPKYSEEEKKYVEIEVPDISGKTADEAYRLLSEAGFSMRTKGSGKIITDQIPKAHTRLTANSTVVAYYEGTAASRNIVVPDVKGMGAADASAEIINAGLNVRIKGVSGAGWVTCSGQSPAAGTSVEPGTVITLDFAYSEIGPD